MPKVNQLPPLKIADIRIGNYFSIFSDDEGTEESRVCAQVLTITSPNLLGFRVGSAYVGLDRLKRIKLEMPTDGFWKPHWFDRFNMTSRLNNEQKISKHFFKEVSDLYLEYSTSLWQPGDRGYALKTPWDFINKKQPIRCVHELQNLFYFVTGIELVNQDKTFKVY